MTREDPLIVLRGQGEEVQCLAFHPSGQFLFSGDAGGTGILWSLTERRPAQHLREIHDGNGGILFCAFLVGNFGRTAAGSPPETVLITHGKDGLVKIWPFTLPPEGRTAASDADAPSPLPLSSRPITILDTGSYGFCRISARVTGAQPFPGAASVSPQLEVEARPRGSDAADASTSGRPQGGLSAAFRMGPSLTGARPQHQRPGPAAGSDSVRPGVPGTEEGPTASSTSALPLPQLLLITHAVDARGVVQVSDALSGRGLAAGSQPGELGLVTALRLIPWEDPAVDAMSDVSDTVAAARGVAGVLAGYEDGSIVLMQPEPPGGRGAAAAPAARRWTLVATCRVAAVHTEPVMSLALWVSPQRRDVEEGGEAGNTPPIKLRILSSSADNRVGFLAATLPGPSPEGAAPTGAAPGKASLVWRQSLELPAPGVADVAVSADGRMAYAAGWDGKVRLIDFRQPRVLCVLKYHTKAATALALVPPGAPTAATERLSLASAARDGAIAVWGDPYKRAAGQ